MVALTPGLLPWGEREKEGEVTADDHRGEQFVKRIAQEMERVLKELQIDEAELAGAKLPVETAAEGRAALTGAIEAAQNVADVVAKV
jgi:hypothetical protein